jgi:asparagine synthase (glutamine-hydrolysing)
MCGIAGIIYFDSERIVRQEELKAMTDTIVHRGPDNEGFYYNKNIGLGFRRLSIIDLKTGNQPISNADESIWIVFNGEIYNFIELRKILTNEGYFFKTQTDTEVILHLYEKYGSDCVKYLRGMFSFAIWDNNINQLFCSRDRFGIKPFFYYCDDNKFVFGSEIKEILKAEGIDKTLSTEAIDSYFTFGYITSDLSIYKNIKKLVPGCTVVVSFEKNRRLKIERYWKINIEADYLTTESQWLEEIENCLSETVKLHMISDVPLGAFLSGGIDSSSIVALMSQSGNQPIKTFSIGFDESEFNELSYSREIARKYKTEHHEFLLKPTSVDLLPTLVSTYDEPFADSSAIPTYFVSKYTREFVTVALSGDGGDELFAGYSAYQKLFNIRNKNILPDEVNKFLFGKVERLIPEKWPGKGILYYLSQKKENLGAYYCLWKENERKNLYQKDFYRNITTRPELYKEFLIQNSTSSDFISRLQELDIQTYMVDDILTKVDRASMLNSLEVRVPLLDHVFAELTFTIPSNLKLFSKEKKYIFKKAMSKYLTPSVLLHKKQGFGVPLTYWFKEDLKEYVSDILGDKNIKAYKYLDYDYVNKQIVNHDAGFRDMSAKIWSILFFNEWLNQNC